MKRVLLFTAILLLNIACVKEQEADNTNKTGVDIRSSGILNNVTMEVVGGLDRGEFTLGSDAEIITINVTNNTKYEITDLVLNIDEQSYAGMKFNPDENGYIASPGYTGDCQNTLAANSACTYKVHNQPTIAGDLTQNITLNYVNLIRAESISVVLSVLSGNPASLIFTSEKINYTFGIVERTEPITYREILQVKNTGDLSAKNIQTTLINTPNSGAYTIVNNSCPLNLGKNQTCLLEVEFEPKNYDATAPDGDEEINYTSNLKMIYFRNSWGDQGMLNAYFTTLATTIEGKMRTGGLEYVEFEKIVVGNIATQMIKVQNKGYKESILHKLDFLNSSGTVVASCVKAVTGTSMACRDPQDVTNPMALVPLNMFPFKVVDVKNCFDLYEKMDYTRDLDGFISDSTIREVVGVDGNLPGESCFFEITFHPSVLFSSDGNFNDWKIRLVYDSTWKNNIVFYGEDSVDPTNFTFTHAEYLSAAKLSVSEFQLDNSPYPNIDPDDDSMFLYDLGRVALLSNSTYKQPLTVRVKNLGGYYAEILSVKDGATVPFTFTETSSDLNTYYLAASHSGCTYLSENGGQCDLRMSLAPIASANPDPLLAENEENSSMYDVAGAYPNRYKKFIITYNDGVMYEDDMTPRIPRVLEIWSRSLLVRKGYLVFEDTNPNMAQNLRYTSGDTRFFNVKLKNIGTGGIPYISLRPGYALEGTVEKSTNLAYPYEIVNRFGPEGGADKDCFDFMVFNEAVPAGVPPGTNAPAVLSAGENCSLMVKMRLRNVDRKLVTDYNVAFPEWERFFSVPDNNTSDAWEFINYQTSNKIISLRFYDGDGIADPSNGYVPTLEGYGNYYLIGGGLNGSYSIGAIFSIQAKLIPSSPLPVVSGVLYRPPVVLPGIALLPQEWGSPIGAAGVGEQWMDLSKGVGIAPGTHWQISKNYVNANFKDPQYDYIFYAGAFKEGEGPYTGQLNIKNAGGVTATNMVVGLSGDPEISLVGTNNNFLASLGQQVIRFEFNPTTSGVYQTIYTISYKNQRKDLTDEDNLIYADVTTELKVLVIFEAVANTAPDLALSSQDYLVEYDAFATPHFTETIMPGQQNYNLLVNNADPASFARFKAIRKSVVYAKKIFTVENTSPEVIYDLTFSIKQSLVSYELANTYSGQGYSISSNNCLGANLNPGETCTFEIKLLAGEFEPLTNTKFGILTYEIASDRYISKGFEIHFEASDPAILKLAGVNSLSVLDQFGNVIEGSYPLDLGYYTQTHVIISNFPVQLAIKDNLQIDNLSTEKASFLAQYREYVGDPTAVIGAGTMHVIYNSGGKKIEANRACMYGDDEGSALDPAKWGFNMGSLQKCKIKLSYSFTDQYLGTQIKTSENIIRLKYYNNERSSTNFVYFHVRGFVEPNRSVVVATDIANVYSASNGTVYFEWQDFTPTTSSWGLIDGYRVFYSKNPNSLNNIYETLGLTYVDTLDNSVTLNGLTPGAYYYFVIVGKRSTNGKSYLSMSNLTRKELIVPPANTFYNYPQKVVVDKYMGADFGKKSVCVSKCSSKYLLLSKNGVLVQRPKYLINSAVFSLIDADPDNSTYPYQAVPHWLSDLPVDIAPIFAPTFDCTVMIGTNEDNTKFYQKVCNTCACNVLSVREGGDGIDLPYGATTYSEGENAVGAYRCYIKQN